MILNGYDGFLLTFHLESLMILIGAWRYLQAAQIQLSVSSSVWQLILQPTLPYIVLITGYEGIAANKGDQMRRLGVPTSGPEQYEYEESLQFSAEEVWDHFGVEGSYQSDCS